MSRRVVVTGLGTVNPLANDVKTFWERTKNGENGIERITRFDVSTYTSQVGGEVRDFDPNNYMDKKDARRMDKFALFALVSAQEAMDDAELKTGENMDPEQLGVMLGNGIGGLETMEDQILKHHGRNLDLKSIHPLFVPKMISNIGPGQIAIKMNAQGPCFTIATACSSGTDAIGNAYYRIKDGLVDAVITGGTEAPFTPTSLGGFCVLQALSTKFNDRPGKASRPFDKDRDGFIMAEGAGIIILEELEHALKRGARIYAEVAGYGVSCDANHLTAPHPEGRGAIIALKMAVRSAGLELEDIDYINAHGTSTPINDPTETKAIKAVFGDHARKLKISSTKSMTGHMLGAAGGVEAVVTVLAIRDQIFPPTRNLDEPDPECDLDYVPGKSVSGRIRAALSNSLGFGGHNGILCFKEFKK
ncbi:MAG TPA: beta-ketoacyl-ACP synthase II [Spirochaetia bacterium]|nr:beta-ketoacyl-ACP synthase II [Spirochaetia bacterium]